MTDEQFQQVEARLSRVEALAESNAQMINQLGKFQVQAFQGLRDLTVEISRVTHNLNQLTERVDQVTMRVDSLAAASERFDRILDYLLRRDGGTDESASS
jgi:methyl-accepting chemotaxis protein